MGAKRQLKVYTGSIRREPFNLYKRTGAKGTKKLTIPQMARIYPSLPNYRQIETQDLHINWAKSEKRRKKNFSAYEK